MFDLPSQKSLKKMLGYSSREPIPADKKRAIIERAGNKCEVCHKKLPGVPLEFHHKNMKNDDNRLSNLQLLCPNHHRRKHTIARWKVYRDVLGNPIASRIIKKKKGASGKSSRKAKSPMPRLTKQIKRDFL